MNELTIRGVEGLPEFEPGMTVGAEIAARAETRRRATSSSSPRRSSPRPRDGCASSPRSCPAAEARRLAAVLGKEPALVELVLEESAEVLRAERGVLIVETKHGLVCANAGIDSSNLPMTTPSACCPRTPTPPPAGSAPSSPRRGGADRRGRHRRQLRPGLAAGPGRGGDRLRRTAAARRLARAPGRQRPRTGGDPDRDRRRGGRRRRPRPRQGERRSPAAVVRGLGRYVGAEDGPGAAALRRPREEDLFR